MFTPPILLTAINARYCHCAMAARFLVANLGRWRDSAAILEADLDVTPFQLATDIVSRQPDLVGFSVYLWNVRLVRETVAILRRVAPCLRIVLGGPEIVADSGPDWRGLADVLIVGEGESAFRGVCEEAMTGGGGPLLEPRVIVAAPEDPANLALPYNLYADTDIAHRTIYVEGSRGCPWRCMYCTSGGTSLRVVPLVRLLPELDRLLERGVRAFRFLDRSFNASEELACGLLDFFHARHPGRLRLHFEIMPCRLPESLRQRMAAFPPGVLHLEVGVQTLNPQVARSIGRPIDNATIFETVRFLMRDARATVHADLVFGLPGEDEVSFAAGFDRLVSSFDPPELQVNLLKCLPGTPLATDPRFAGLVFNPNPPYELLGSDVLDFAAIGRLQQFARCWELIHNRGRFPCSTERLRQGDGVSPFSRYMELAGRIQSAEGRIHTLSLDCLAGHLARYLKAECGLSDVEAGALVAADRASSLRSRTPTG